MNKIITGLATVALAAALTACGGSDTGGGASASELATAKAHVQDIASEVEGVSLGTVYTAKTDPNEMLGRPGRYTSKAECEDAKMESETQAWACSVEVFEDAETAEKRSEYIKGLQEASPILGTEYHTLDGSALLRVSGVLTPDRAGLYAAAFMD